MKIKKTESYTITDLSSLEISFLREMLEKVNLSDDTSELSINLLDRWRELLIEDKGTLCQGCDQQKQSTKKVSCPINNKQDLLCSECYQARKDIGNQILEQE